MGFNRTHICVDCRGSMGGNKCYERFGGLGAVRSPDTPTGGAEAERTGAYLHAWRLEVSAGT